VISIVGGGSWGTALAIHLAKNAGAVRLWAREPEVVEGIRARRRSPWYLPDVDIPAGVAATTDAAEAVNGASVVVVAVPSEFFAATLKSVGPLSDAVPIVTATKGFDPERHVRMSEVVGEQFPRARVAALSGPTFAREVALGRPTAAVIASRDDGLAATLQRTLGSREFRLYANRDVVGVGENARAALITRGLAEMTRLAVALGGAPATLSGLAGLGDLVLTCTGSLSRNRQLGIALTRGRTVAAVERETRMVAEGVRTVTSALALARRHSVSMPICEEVGAVLFEGKAPTEALTSLLERPLRREEER